MRIYTHRMWYVAEIDLSVSSKIRQMFCTSFIVTCELSSTVVNYYLSTDSVTTLSNKMDVSRPILCR